ncbi:MAG: carbohydrate porin [Nitrospirae bacterium]|nr:carbohydrate porin [Nitrospirota bacterium]
MFKRLVVVVMVLLLTVSLSYGSESEAILKLLLKKGVITQKEYEELVIELKTVGTPEEAKDKAGAEPEAASHQDKHMLHEKDGIPNFFKGLSVAGNVVTVGQTTSGNKKNNPPGGDVTNANLRAQFEVGRPLGENGQVFFKTEAGVGKGLVQDGRLDTFLGVNETAANKYDSYLWVREAWYEHKLLEGKLTFTFGKLDFANYFDTNAVANNENNQFLSSGFVNSKAIELPSFTGGVRMTISPVELIYVSLGWQRGDSQWENIFNKPFLIAEVGVKPKIGELQGNYRINAWTNRTDHIEIKDPTNKTAKGWGTGLSADQQVTDSLTLFGRLGYQDGKVYKYDVAWSAGLALSGKLWGRNDDVLGLAYGMAILSKDYRDYMSASKKSHGDENRAELYYSILLKKYLVISPDVQYISNALGDRGFHNVWVFGLRTKIFF